MDFKQAKIGKKKNEIDINLVNVTVVPKKTKFGKSKISWTTRTLEIVYKKVKINNNDDLFFIERIKSYLGIKDDILILKVDIIKNLGKGIYEE